MNGYNFTERVRVVLRAARDKAFELGHEYVGTEHLLLGLLEDEDGVAAAVLKNVAVGQEALRASVLGFVKRGDPAASRGPDLPYTSRAKKVLELSMKHARELHHSYVGTEHLLLGLIAEEKGIAAQVLQHAGLTLQGTHAEILRLLGAEVPSTPEPTVPPSGAKSPGSAVSFTVLIEFPGGHLEVQRFARSSEAVEYLQRFSR